MTGKRRKNRCLSYAEMDMLLDHADRSTPLKMRTTILIHVLAGCGLKVYEAIELMMTDVNTSIGYLYAGRGEKHRSLPMDDRTIPLMEDYLSGRRGLLEPECDNLLVSNQKTQLTRDGVTKIVRTFGRVKGLPGLNPEIIRHSFVVHLYRREKTSVFLERAGIHPLTIWYQNMPKLKTDFRKTLEKYHPRF